MNGIHVRLIIIGFWTLYNDVQLLNADVDDTVFGKNVTICKKKLVTTNDKRSFMTVLSQISILPSNKVQGQSP